MVAHQVHLSLKEPTLMNFPCCHIVWRRRVAHWVVLPVWPSVAILSRKQFSVRELVFHIAVDVSNARPVLCCAVPRIRCSRQSLLLMHVCLGCGLKATSALQWGGCLQPCSAPVVMLPVLALPLSKGATTSSHVNILFICKKKRWTELFLWRKSYRSLMEGNRATFPGLGAAQCAALGFEACCVLHGCQHLRIIYMIPFLLIVLAPTNSIWEVVYRACVFLTGMITSQHL